MLEVPPICLSFMFKKTIMPFYASINNYALIPPYYGWKIYTALWQLEEPGSET